MTEPSRLYRVTFVDPTDPEDGKKIQVKGKITEINQQLGDHPVGLETELTDCFVEFFEKNHYRQLGSASTLSEAISLIGQKHNEDMNPVIPPAPPPTPPIVQPAPPKGGTKVPVTKQDSPLKLRVTTATDKTLFAPLAFAMLHADCRPSIRFVQPMFQTTSTDVATMPTPITRNCK